MSEPNEPNPTPENPAANLAPAEPSPVSRDEFNGLKQTLETLNVSLQALASARSEPYAAPAPKEDPLPTQAEIAADLAEGKPDKLMSFVTRAVEKVRRDEVEPLRNQGAQSLSMIARQTAINSGSMPYLDKVKKDVDAAFEKIPLQQRTTPEAYQACYQFVVGNKLPEIVKEETEKAVRQGREQSPTQTPGSTGGRAVSSSPEGKTAFEKVFDATALGSLREQGRTPDEFARKMGFKSAEEYALFAVKQGEGNG